MTRMPAWAAAIAAALIVLGLTTLYDRLELERFQSGQRALVLDRLSTKRATLEASLNARLHLVRGLAAFVQTGDDVTEARFSAFATALLGTRTEVRGLILAPNCIVRYVYPLETNASALGVNLLEVPRFQTIIRQTIATNRLTVAGPAALVQGGTGLLGRIPVFHQVNGERVLWGLAIIVLDVPSLLAEAQLVDDKQLSYAIRGRDGLGPQGEVFFGNPDLFNETPVLLDVSIPNGSWQLAAAPARGWRSWPGSPCMPCCPRPPACAAPLPTAAPARASCARRWMPWPPPTPNWNASPT